MAKKTYRPVILVGPVAPVNIDRRDFEHIENQKIDSIEEFNKVFGEGFFHVTMYELTDFMDLCNNQEISLEGVWIGYIQLNTEVKV